MPSLPIIDPSAIENLRELNPGDNDEFLREVAVIYLEDTPERLAELEECLASGDVPRFTRAAHSIKGSSANMGAMVLREIAEKLEHQSKDTPLAQLVPMIAEARAAFAAAEAEIRNIAKL
ncbi:MAG: Hpt domain-containing protein [Opitutaceae bacterium]|jgi:HPt (histidine-containing phosphotransfer) domain-containing protein|nr:Hpt domain-containing protein [Opitutaceae bacterium]HNW40561.1 Hpt domain-containing protein [Opitutaceae bacterium]